jgi:hypothetical protein
MSSHLISGSDQIGSEGIAVALIHLASVSLYQYTGHARMLTQLRTLEKPNSSTPRIFRRACTFLNGIR